MPMQTLNDILTTNMTDQLQLRQKLQTTLNSRQAQVDALANHAIGAAGAVQGQAAGVTNAALAALQDVNAQEFQANAVADAKLKEALATNQKMEAIRQQFEPAVDSLAAEQVSALKSDAITRARLQEISNQMTQNVMNRDPNSTNFDSNAQMDRLLETQRALAAAQELNTANIQQRTQEAQGLYSTFNAKATMKNKAELDAAGILATVTNNYDKATNKLNAAKASIDLRQAGLAATAQGANAAESAMRTAAAAGVTDTQLLASMVENKAKEADLHVGLQGLKDERELDQWRRDTSALLRSHGMNISENMLKPENLKQLPQEVQTTVYRYGSEVLAGNKSNSQADALAAANGDQSAFVRHQENMSMWTDHVQEALSKYEPGSKEYQSLLAQYADPKTGDITPQTAQQYAELDNLIGQQKKKLETINSAPAFDDGGYKTPDIRAVSIDGKVNPNYVELNKTPTVKLLNPVALDAIDYNASLGMDGAAAAASYSAQINSAAQYISARVKAGEDAHKVAMELATDMATVNKSSIAQAKLIRTNRWKLDNVILKGVSIGSTRITLNTTVPIENYNAIMAKLNDSNRFNPITGLNQGFAALANGTAGQVTK